MFYQTKQNYLQEKSLLEVLLLDDVEKESRQLPQ
jgi:hypothetical protein